MGMKQPMISNVVNEQTLRKVQINALKLYSDAIKCTYGPMGEYTGYSYKHTDSNGTGKIPAASFYTKDGLTVLRAILVDRPIEYLLKDELINICKEVVKKVGDGTTTATILTNLIYKGLVNLESKGYSKRQLLKTLKEVIKEGTDIIKDRSRECTTDDIYNIAYTALNGNEEIANVIKGIYEESGLSVFIDVSASNNENTMVKTYNGMTYHTGFIDACFANTKDETNNVSFVGYNVNVYVFESPVDTPEMSNLLRLICEKEIFSKLQGKEKITPTVILTPVLSRDNNSYIDSICATYNSLTMEQRPPLCVVTKLNKDYHDLLDIAELSGAKLIKKYIDPQAYKIDQKQGLAPTEETITSFAGKAEKVIIDQMDTRIINPQKMYDDEGNYTTFFNNYIGKLKSALSKYQETGEDFVQIGHLKRRINILTANMVDLYVGGLGISDKNALIDAIEDAVLNCRSAAKDGVSNAANFEGLISFIIIANNLTKQLEDTLPTDEEFKSVTLKLEVANILSSAYITLANMLYSPYTEGTELQTQELIKESINQNVPFNILTGEYDGKVLTSAQTEPVILNAIDKIISIFYNTNQYLLPDTSYASMYEEVEEEPQNIVLNEKESIPLSQIIGEMDGEVKTE